MHGSDDDAAPTKVYSVLGTEYWVLGTLYSVLSTRYRHLRRCITRLRTLLSQDTINL